MSKVRILDLETYLPSHKLDFEKGEIISSNQGSEKEIMSFETTIEDDIYQKKKEELEQSAILEEEDEGVPEWVNNNIKRGVFGEQLALLYLKEQYSNVQLVTYDSSRGYDIEVNKGSIIGYEIKTSNTTTGFNITINELNVAKKKQNNYFIMFITIDQHKAEVTGHIIQNPLKAFEIDYDILTKHTELTNVFVQPKHFFIQFKRGFFNNLEKIPLEKYLRK